MIEAGKPREECGVFGIYAPGEDVAKLTFFGLFTLQHRGQESAGIGVFNGGKPKLHKKMGLVNQVFDDYDLSMRNKLKGQLLAMKFNVAHFGAGDYFVASEGKTINQIIAEADGLLLQDPEPSQDILEAIKNILESLVDLQMQVCSLTPPPVMEEESVLLNIIIKT